MKKLEKLEQEIKSLSPEEAAEFRAWFLELRLQRTTIALRAIRRC